jgi:peroxiredoxin
MPLSFSTFLAVLMLGGGTDLGRPGAGVQAVSRSSPVSPFTLAEPPESEVCVGDPAPDFSYQGYDGRWMRLHHLLDQGPVLLVFGMNEAQLAVLERQREDLLSLGVIPVAVLDRRPGSSRALVSRLGLKYTLLSDPRLVIATQFNAVESGRVTPSCFVVDGHGKVRGLRRGRLPPEDYPRLCARSLALAMPGTLFPTSR